MYTSLYVRVITSVFCCVEQISFLFNIALERRCMMKVKIHRMKIDVPSESSRFPFVIPIIKYPIKLHPATVRA